MTKLILAISPDLTLLEQISAHLQEGGRFQIFRAASAKEALALAATQPFNLAILDAEINDLPFIPLTRELVGLLPNLKLLIYPPQNNPHHPVLRGVVANGYLNKPFFGPEVNEKIQRVLNDESIPANEPVGIEDELPRLWVEHPDTGVKQIEQLLASTTASAGLLLMHGHVIAGSGALADETSQNIVNFLTRYWSNIQVGELFRYLKMDNETKTYLVYATPLLKNVAFALIYHTNISLLEIRNEVSNIRKTFLNRYANTGELRQEFVPAAEAPNPGAPLIATVPPVEPVASTPMAETVPAETKTDSSIPFEVDPLDDSIEPQELSDDPEEEELPTGLSEKELQNLDALLAEMPAPDPEEEISPDESKEENTEFPLELPELDSAAASDPEPESAPVSPDEWSIISDADASPELESSPIPASPALTSPTAPEATPSKLGDTVPIHPVQPHSQSVPSAEFPDFNFTLPWEGENPDQEDSAPVVHGAPVDQGNFWKPSTAVEPIENDPSAIFFEYHFLLLPRSPQQFITHEIANLLNDQLPKLHESCGWQCTSLSIRPLYLQWTAILPVAVCLCDMVDEIKRRSEIQIFAIFPQLLQTYPSGEFWAAGYFALSGSQSFSSRLINDYISLSRQILSTPLPG